MLLLAPLLLASSAAAAAFVRPADDPRPDPAAVVAIHGARFTVLSDRLIRMEIEGPSRAGAGGDDRATAVVINRRLAVPKFTVAHPNASALTITTAALRLTYHHSPAPPVEAALMDSCSCGAMTCSSSGHNISWALHNNSQGADGKRTPGCPNGLTNQTLDSCFCACVADPDCEGLTYAPPGQSLARSCWLLTDVSKTMPTGPARVFVGALNGGPSKGFTYDNLLIEFLDPDAPLKTWRPSMYGPGGGNSAANLNGSYTNLDCYTVPAKCAASNAAKMQHGLLSREGWAIWDDIKSQRMSPSPVASWKQWHVKNGRDGSTSSDLYFFGHGLDFKGVLKDFLQISGPPGLLSAADCKYTSTPHYNLFPTDISDRSLVLADGLWWSNSFPFTKDQFLNRIISNFTKHKLPFTHLVMDDGWHQPDSGVAGSRVWASYTWNASFGDASKVSPSCKYKLSTPQLALHGCV